MRCCSARHPGSPTRVVLQLPVVTASKAPEAPEVFRQAVAALRSVRPRPEVQLEEVRPPQRLAPWAFAITAEVNGPAEVLATGRLVLLHDPQGQEAWDGVLRVVTYVRAELDAELASDPLLPAVGWSWLTDALEASGAKFAALGGTVTETSSARFGDIAGPARTDDLELRASWTPRTAELQPHGEAFCDLLASVVGLPPVGVTLFKP
ncbi:DUF3000 domain-containing protein [Kibdelosporangium aridum]|uniref:DUF3000 domain-containing protein n=1 Tax=Kibdelosporangium aridum TaxID=2030 RepID=A0A428YZY4_KIBAR|nr:DUF3000 domain-containing protein [Kibdelosporangium aridum]